MNGYYERNKKKIKDNFKRRYNSDPDFRQAQIDRVGAYKKKKAFERKLLKEKTKSYKKIWRKFKVKDKITACCRVGYLANSLERTTQTIRKWEKAGFLPPTIRFKTQRYYTEAHYKMILSMWNKTGNGKELEKFFQLIMREWNKQYKVEVK